jgi:NAD(P)-dependent dehydrogenase (short-subunit alcohol dehydrogenase family)
MQNTSSGNHSTQDRWAMFPDLRGRVAVVTGGGRGIGSAISHSLAAAGAHVVVAARTESEITTVADEIRGDGGESSALQVDLSKEDDVNAMFAQVHDRLGRLDVLIANAAIALTGPLIDFATTDLDALLAVNLRGTFLCCRQALKIMAPQRSGYIIVISSIAGLKTYPEQSAYAATKHGLMGMTKGLAIEAQEYGIRVSAVLPGGVDTQMVRAARPDLDRSVLLQSDDIAKTILFLLSLADRAAIDQIYIRRRASQPFP